MAKYIRIDEVEESYLIEKAISLKYVFKSPNYFLRDILGLKPRKTRNPSSKESKTKRKRYIKIRIDDEVYEKLKTLSRPINKSIEAICEKNGISKPQLHSTRLSPEASPSITKQDRPRGRRA